MLQRNLHSVSGKTESSECEISEILPSSCKASLIFSHTEIPALELFTFFSLSGKTFIRED